MLIFLNFALHFCSALLLIAVVVTVLKSLEFWSRLILDSRKMMSSKFRVYSLSYFMMTSSPYIDEGLAYKTVFIRLWNSVLVLSAVIGVLLVARTGI